MNYCDFLCPLAIPCYNWCIMFDIVGLLVVMGIGAVLFVLSQIIFVMYSTLYPERMREGLALAKGYPVSPQEIGLQAEEKTFLLTQKIESKGWMLAGDKPDGPVTIVLHGYYHSRLAALSWAQPLAAWSSNVIVFDARSHGDTRGMCDFAKYAVEDIKAVLAQCECDTKPLVLAGLSMGAAAALRGALDPAIRKNLVGICIEGAYDNLRLPMLKIIASRKQPYWIACLAWKLLTFKYPFLVKQNNFDTVAVLSTDGFPIQILHAQNDPICDVSVWKNAIDTSPVVYVDILDADVHLGLPWTSPQDWLQASQAFYMACDAYQQQTKTGI